MLSFSTVKPQKSSKLVNVYSAVKSLSHARHNAGGGIREVSHIIRQCVNKTIPPPNNAVSLSVKARNIYFSHFSSSVSLYRRSHDSALVQMNLLRGGKKRSKQIQNTYNRQKLITIMLIKICSFDFFFLSEAAHFKSMLLFLAKKKAII